MNRKEPYKCFCGPSYFPKFIRRWLSFPFNAACRLHDIHYSQKKKSRKEADDIFLRNMLKKSINWRERLLARTYYVSVRIFGWTQY